MVKGDVKHIWGDALAQSPRISSTSNLVVRFAFLFDSQHFRGSAEISTKLAKESLRAAPYHIDYSKHEQAAMHSASESAGYAFNYLIGGEDWIGTRA
jgi:hypothetical protein